MTNINNDFSFQSFKEINKPNFFGDIEYIYAILKIKQLPVDFLYKIINLVFPSFLELNDCIFLENEFDEKKFKELKEAGEENIQFWMNLIEFKSLHEDLSAEQALFLASKIADSWNSKIKYEGIVIKGRARAFKDDEYGEVFLTID